MKSKKIKSKVNYKSKYLHLKNKYENLLKQNSVLQLFHVPTVKQKLEAIEEYFDYLSQKDYDANTMQSFCEYKQYLKKNNVSQH